MQIQKIKATNFKTYLNLDLDLQVEEECPIILIGGNNGGGKTTLFEAIYGALYGLNIKNKQQFEELLNNGAFGKVEPKIELELVFTGQVLHQTQKYVLRRSYILNPAGKPVESVYLNMNGSVFSYGTATPANQRAIPEQQVKKIIKANLPQELSQYFLFDAMQSSKLLEDNVFAQIIRDNFQNVLGFNKYVQLKKSSEKLLQERSMQRLKAEKEVQEYNKLCEEKQKLEEELGHNETSQDLIFKYLTSMKQTYDKAKQGAEDQEHIRLQVQQLSGTILETEKKATDYVEQLKDFIETIEINVFLPKLSASLSPVIDAILKKKEELRRALEQRYTAEEVEDITKKVIAYLKEFSLITENVEPMNVSNHILASQKDFVAKDDYAFLEDNDLEALKGLKKLNAVNNFIQLDNQRKSLDEDIKELPNLKIQRDSLQSTLTQGSTNIIKEYEEKKRELENLKKDVERINSEIAKIDTKIKSYDVQIQQEPDVKYDTLMKLVPFFEEVANSLLTSKKALIESQMKEQLNKLLLSYQGHIERVELSDRLDNFTIKMYHTAGNEISLSQLNAASKQIFIQVLLKVLRNLGDYNPPVMIDTVMGVLDESSRDVLMEEYFPELAEQTILLCTTSEIRKDSDYKKLEPFISKTYTLHRNVEEQNTSVEEGYFGIPLYK
ncbi:MAG: DNA sulfur modification protein DndD [Bacteroidaceae bacterium]|nr:DNA sulfur modification protein DndD [Bacteroidaceae bacterium]